MSSLPDLDDSWVAAANARIEEIRKSQVEFNFLNVEATELSIEVEQLSHSFPFGQAVSSERIAECHYSGQDHEECLFIRNNYNWIVDTWRSTRPVVPALMIFSISSL